MGKELVIAEKPSVARDYAKVLRCSQFGEGFIEGSNYIVTWALGHLFTLKEPQDYDESNEKWNLENLPIIPEKFETKLINDPGVRKQFKAISELAKRDDVDRIVLGCDAGREGELIGRYIIEALGWRKEAYRLWLSSLTDSDIEKGFKSLKPLSLYDNLYYSAKARNELDWIFGMNLSRAYTVIKGKGVLLSIGRCQTAVLSQIVKRDYEIENFKPVPFWQVNAVFSPNISARYEKDGSSRIFDKHEAEKIVQAVSGKYGVIEDVRKEIKRKPHPLLYNLTNLQRTLNRKYGYSAQNVLDAMQALYEKHKILSYPRTAARHITQSMVEELPGIIKNLQFGKFKEYSDYCLAIDKLPVTKRLADDSLVTDHTAIIPTVNKDIEAVYERLGEVEKNVFDEVALCFLSAFYGDYVYESCMINTSIEGYSFISKGIKEINMGWKEVYREQDDDEGVESNVNLPDVNMGDRILCNEAKAVEKKTTPPSRYTENLLLEMMENPGGLLEEDAMKQAIKGHGIGTDATRAAIIETLVKRNYIKREKKAIVSTRLGRELINCIDNELIKSVELTAKWEANLAMISSGEMGKDDFINETICFVKEEIQRLKEDKSDMKIEADKPEMIGKCPVCGGNVYRNKSGYGCSNWKNGCKFFIGGEIAGKKISEAQARKLVTKGKTDLIKAFKSKSGNSFDACLAVKEGKIVFDFPDNNRKKS